MTNMLMMVLGAWSVVITIVVLVVIRQVSLISVRLDLSMRLPNLSGVGVGPELGMALDIAPEVVSEDCLLVAVTGTCNSCHEFIKSLGEVSPLAETELILLLAGRGAGVREITRFIPDWVTVVRDPAATRLGARIELSRTTVALHVVKGRLVGRADVHTESELLSLVDASRMPGNERRNV